jgi:hypothetical protein
MRKTRRIVGSVFLPRQDASLSRFDGFDTRNNHTAFMRGSSSTLALRAAHDHDRIRLASMICGRSERQIARLARSRKPLEESFDESAQCVALIQLSPAISSLVCLARISFLLPGFRI